MPNINDPRPIQLINGWFDREGVALANAEVREWLRGDREELDEILEELKGAVKEKKRGEELFHLILSGIREIYDVDAMIAGGAARDLAAGTTDHKDIDVFIPGLSWNNFHKKDFELGWKGEPVKIVGHKYKDQKAKVGCSFPTTARAQAQVQGVPIDLVFLEKPLSKEDVETFPVFAQRCGWTLDRGLVIAPEAKEDIENKQFTINPTITDKETTEAVLEKIKGWKKRPFYKDWKVVEPGVKEWWEAKEAEAARQKREEQVKFDTFTTSTGDTWKIML